MSNQQNIGDAEEEWQKAMGQRKAAHRHSAEFQHFLASPPGAINNAQISFLPPSPTDSLGNSLPNSRKSSVDSTAGTIPIQNGGPSNDQALAFLSPIFSSFAAHQALGAKVADSAEQQQMQMTMGLANIHPPNFGYYGQMAAENMAVNNDVNSMPFDLSNWSEYVCPEFLAKHRADLQYLQQFHFNQNQFHQNHSAITGLEMPSSSTSTTLLANQLCPAGIDPGMKMALPSHSLPINSSPMDFLPGNGQNALNGDKENEKMLREIRDFVKSPIMDFICEILLDENRKHICSFIGPREFLIHDSETFAKMLHLAKAAPFKEKKSYLKIARAMKSFELREKNGHVVMRKVPEKRNQYKFYPDLP